MTPFVKLRNELAKFVSLSVDEIDAINKVATVANFKKGQFFTKEGETCNQVGLLTKGIFRVYHLSESKEITSYFNTSSRNPFISSFSSFLKREPSKEFVVALEDSEAVMILRNDLLELYRQFHAMERLGRLMAEYNYLLALNRIDQLQYLSAGERYEDFLKTYPGLINLIPNHYIASYLGITPESLSRIRKDLIK